LGREKRGEREGKGGKEKGEGKRNGNEKEMKGERRGGEEKDKGKGGRKGNGRGKGEKGRNFVQLWFGKTPPPALLCPRRMGSIKRDTSIRPSVCPS